jgi:hypothetical protein
MADEQTPPATADEKNDGGGPAIKNRTAGRRAERMLRQGRKQLAAEDADHTAVAFDLQQAEVCALLELARAIRETRQPS